MGVPTFFRWLCTRYPKAIRDAVVERITDTQRFPGVQAEVPLPVFPECEAPYLDEVCPDDLDAEWWMISTIPEYAQDNIREAAHFSSAKNTLDLVIVANGILHDRNIFPEKKISDITEEKFKEVFFVNTILPSIIAKHFIPKLSKNNQSILAFMSARVGSISDNKLGGWYAYRASKAVDTADSKH